MTLLVALVATTLFIADSMKAEYKQDIQTAPDIVVSAQKALRYKTIDETQAARFLEIDGVSNAIPRVWGEYYFAKGNVRFKIVGLDEFENSTNSTLNRLRDRLSYDTNMMLLSPKVKAILNKNYYKDYFNFILQDGTLLRVNISQKSIAIPSIRDEYLIVMPKELARKIFAYADNEATDIAVSVKNSEEIAFSARKIAALLGNAKISIKDDLIVEYEQMYNYRSGFFLTIFIITFFTFFVIIYDRLSGLNSEQKREIGILKAIGWRVEDVLKTKLYEGLIISLFSYSLGIILAMVYTFIFNGGILKNIFLSSSRLLEHVPLQFHLDYATLALLFLISVPLYICATIIPSWIAATVDADEVMR